VARVGIIGLGLVGSALAERLTAAGFEVVGYDIAAGRIAALAAIGGVPAASAMDVARQCERIILSLPTSDISAEVIEEIADELAGKLVLDTTTGEPDAMARLGQSLARRQADYVDATIAGSSSQVRRGEVVVMLGGSEAAVERGADLVRTFAAQSFHLGPVGSGARMKLVVNLVLGLNRAVLAEGLAFAQASGIDPAEALEVLRAGPAFSRVMDTKGPRMLAGDFAPEARLAQHHKDVRLILSAAAEAGAKVPLSELHERLLAALVDAGCGELDNCAIVRAFATEGLARTGGT
jgi:3-hydroxyisobutyrate dehydrogenase-like beta-hydroxyacid dehydrogenase